LCRSNSEPRAITNGSDGNRWFVELGDAAGLPTGRFGTPQGVPQGVGRLNPVTCQVTTFPTSSNPGPVGIAASPDGPVWFT
jgi:streptogramin lyase